jgi:hypothetical protein
MTAQRPLHTVVLGDVPLSMEWLNENAELQKLNPKTLQFMHKQSKKRLQLIFTTGIVENSYGMSNALFSEGLKTQDVGSYRIEVPLLEDAPLKHNMEVLNEWGAKQIPKVMPKAKFKSHIIPRVNRIRGEDGTLIKEEIDGTLPSRIFLVAGRPKEEPGKPSTKPPQNSIPVTIRVTRQNIDGTEELVDAKCIDSAYLKGGRINFTSVFNIQAFFINKMKTFESIDVDVCIPQLWLGDVTYHTTTYNQIPLYEVEKTALRALMKKGGGEMAAETTEEALDYEDDDDDGEFGENDDVIEGGDVQEEYADLVTDSGRKKDDHPLPVKGKASTSTVSLELFAMKSKPKSTTTTTAAVKKPAVYTGKNPL